MDIRMYEMRRPYRSISGARVIADTHHSECNLVMRRFHFVVVKVPFGEIGCVIQRDRDDGNDATDAILQCLEIVCH